MNRLTIFMGIAGIAVMANAEVAIIRGGAADQPSGEQSAVIINTRDRAIVPATIDTKESKTATGTRTETITRLRGADGNYFEWLRAADVVREVSPGTTERTTELVERDRQGGERERKLIKQTTVKTEAGERTQSTEYRRDSSGRMVMSRDITSTSAKTSDGSTAQARTESEYDVNGRPSLIKQVDSVTTADLTGRIKTTTSTTKSFDHLAGRVGTTQREIATVRTDGNTTRTETLTQKPDGAGWDNSGRIVSTQSQAPDGTIQRETIVEGRSQYARQTGARTDNEELVPQSKVVEQEVRQPNGTVIIQRDMYRRDVNGDWKPTTFSTDGALTAY